MHGSGIARPGFASRPRQFGRFKTVANRAEPDRLGAVLALVVGDLTRTWTKQQRRRGPTLTTPLTQWAPANEREEQMETVGRRRRQGAAGARAHRADHSHPAQRPPDRGHDRGQAQAGHRSPVSD